MRAFADYTLGLVIVVSHLVILSVTHKHDQRLA